MEKNPPPYAISGFRDPTPAPWMQPGSYSHEGSHYSPDAHHQNPYGNSYPSPSTPVIYAQPPAAPQSHVTNVNISTQPALGSGTCPVCHHGTFTGSFTCCGWLCCIFCFPIGILFCCCCMREKKCNHCGYSP